MTRHSPKPHAVSRRRFMGRMAVAAGLSAAGVPTLAGPGTPQAGRLRAGAAIADITPPIGVSCFVVNGLCPDATAAQVFRGAVRFLPAYFIVYLLLNLFPEAMVGALAGFVK